VTGSNGKAPRRRIDVGEAAALIAARMPRGWGTVRVPLEDAHGEVLRQVITAERDQPPFDRVTMDGIAIRHAAFATGRRSFTVLGTQAAGSPPLPLAGDGGCIAIMTGAALPPGADTVVPVERLAREGDNATVAADYVPAAGQFVHRRASDHRQGDPLLSPGSVLGPPEMAILTVGGADTVEVARRPAIAIVSTGDELVDAGLPLAPTQIRASNDRAIAAALASRGFLACDRLHLRDDRALLESALGELLAEQDVLILTGGVSMGEFDFVPKVLADLGLELAFHKVLQRPGQPLWFGVSPDGKPVFALPGNPVSSLVCLVRYVAPALLAALGAEPRAEVIARLDRHVRFEPDLTYFLPVTLRHGADGECLATPKPTNTSGDFVALGGTDGFVELPRGMADFAPGYTARFWSW
jgi:molybdopterin molybdotransferase